MEEQSYPETPVVEPIAESEIVALVAMLDYLIGEISKVDAMAASCLLLARKSLLEAVADALVKLN